MIKTKRTAMICLLFTILLLGVVCFGFMGFGNTKVYAATTPKYTMTFSGTHTNLGWGANGLQTQITDQTKISVQKVWSSGDKEDVIMYLSGSSVSGSATLANYGYINSSQITYSSSVSATLKIYNSKGQEVASGNDSITTTLSDGQYKATLYKKKQSGAGYTQWGYSLDLYSYFNIDTNAPSLNGASTSTTGKYVNSSFTVSASDSGSGLSKLYWKLPTSSSYSSTTSSNKTISSSSANGLYRFYAEDKAGNTSATYYAYLDTVAPTGKFSLKNGNTIESGGSTKEAFSFTASDGGSGVSKIEYAIPTAPSTWKNYSAGTYIQPTEAQGVYTFRVTDKSQNTSVYTINLFDPCAEGHTYVAKVVSPTCTSGGYTVYICSECGESYTGDNTSALGHSYQATTTIGSCTSGGYTTYTCSRCGDSYTGNPTEPTGHSFSASVTEPTCTSGGFTTYTCAKCGYSYTGNETEAIGHSYEATTSPSSCTEAGYTTYKCARCGMSYTDSPSQATGHSYVASIVEATCTERGYTTYTCSKCGDSYRDNETAPLGHNYMTEVVSATCTEKGETIYTCTRCGASYKGSETEPSGHSYVTESVTATCEEGGYTLHTCSKCGQTYKDNITQPLGHNFVTVTKEATCTEHGKIVYTCQICGYERAVENGVYPTGHNYANYIVKAATCTEAGERRYVCDKCDDEYTEVIAATGHSYAITDSYSEKGKTVRTYTCMTCGDSYTQEMGDQYEEVSSYVEELFEQYRPYMIWVFLGTAAIWSIVMGVFFAIAQKNEEKEKAKKMIVNYFIGLVVIFAILVACPFLVRGIAILVT